VTTESVTGAVWWRQPFRTFQTNLREIDAGLDVDRVLDFLDDFGADVWLLSVGGIVSNYPTELDFQTANPALAERSSGDLVGDAVASASARGVRVLGRMDFSKIDRRRAEEHPDWCFVSPAGDNQVYNGLVSVCPSGDYYQHRIFDVITEVLTRYELSGFFFNWMSYNEYDYSRKYWGVCQCLACHSRFARFAPGVTLPRDQHSPGYDVWRVFTREALDELTARMRGHVRELAPEAALILGDRADIVFHEANNAVGRPLWHHRTSEAVSAAKSYRPDVPVLVNAVGFVDMPYRLAGEDPNHFAQYLIQAIAHGAVPSTYVMGRPEDSPYANLAVAGEVSRFYRDHAGVYAGLTSAAQVVLVRPDPLTTAPDRLAEQTSEFQGLYLSLLEAHIPCDVLAADRVADLAVDATASSLGRYRLVILPDLGALDHATVSALDGYVAAGGTVLCTGASAFEGERSQLAASPVARRVSSFDTVEATRSLHLALGVSQQQPLGHPAPMVGAFHVVEATTEAAVDWPSLSRAPYGPPEKCYGHLLTGHPGWLSASHGAGGVGVMPWTPGRVYREVGLSQVRDAVVARVLALAGPEVQVGGNLPEQVQVVASRNADGLVLHLLNRSGDAPQRFLRPVRLGPLTIELPWDGAAATASALVAGQRLEVDLNAGRLRMTVPALDRFEVVNFA
jgi:hypothetical protein